MEVRALRGVTIALLAVTVVILCLESCKRRHEELEQREAEPRPSNRRRSPVNRTTLIDISNFKFEILDHHNNKPGLWAAFIYSAIYNFYHRRVIRNTWGKGQKIVFLLGRGNSTEQTLIEDEAREFGDIVQGNFRDSYRNLTYKHAMGLLWAGNYCRGTSFIIKADDDVFINTPKLESFLSSAPSRRYIGCSVLKDRKIERNPRYAYFVSPEEYKSTGTHYPSYCAGWIIIYTLDVVNALYVEAQKEPYFWIEDIHMTGTLASRLELSLSSLGKLALLPKETEKLLNNPNDEFLFALTLPTKFSRLWSIVNNSSPFNNKK